MIPAIFKRLAPATLLEKIGIQKLPEKPPDGMPDDEDPPLVDYNKPLQINGLNFSIPYTKANGRDEEKYPKNSTASKGHGEFHKLISDLLNQEEATHVSPLETINFTYSLRCTFVSEDVDG